MFWQSTLDDLKVKLRLYYGLKQILIVQDYQVFLEVAAVALGGKSSSSRSQGTTGNSEAPQTEAQMIAAFNSVFGKK